MQIPGIWTAGDTITWVDSVAFDNQGNAITPDAWTLLYSLRGPSALDLTSTTASGGWSVTAFGFLTAQMPPGDYWWQATAVAIADGARFTCGSGQVLVQPNLAEVVAPPASAFTTNPVPNVNLNTIAVPIVIGDGQNALSNGPMTVTTDGSIEVAPGSEWEIQP